MPENYVSPNVKSALTQEEIRQRYRDTSLVIFKEHHLHQSRRKNNNDPNNTNYLSFGVNRRTMTYSNNGNEAVVVHRTISKASGEANDNSRFGSHIMQIYRKPRESCTIS